ncbi:MULTISPECIES: restriction endonuclease [Pseudomonas]|uniref:restriction endonuclease n=1 Tax=Pseudomonas TaxID=286 RepID=UPI000F03E2CD|nr:MULTISPECIES: restriction endonuclease [Pseudomonas]MBD8682078.1 restriction endonuclease [Pseudomonas sp. CFBP 13719]
MNEHAWMLGLLLAAPALLFIEPGIELLFGKRKGRGLYRQAKKKGLSAVSGMTWQQFEQLCAGYFRAKGYRVEMCGQGGADGGRDLILKKSGKRILVQCKHWRSRVGVTVVREMFGVMHAERFDQVIIVGTSGFTKDAWSWSKGKSIRLMDANSLIT